MDTKPIYRDYLHTAFAACKYDHDQVTAMLKQFDQMCERASSPEVAFAVALDKFGNEDTEQACASVADYIAHQMDKYNATHAGIPTQHRLAALIKRYNKNISTLAGISVNLAGKNLTLTDEELENCKINNMSHCLKAAETHTATASTKDNPRNRGCNSLVIDVRYF